MIYEASFIAQLESTYNRFTLNFDSCNACSQSINHASHQQLVFTFKILNSICILYYGILVYHAMISMSYCSVTIIMNYTSVIHDNSDNNIIVIIGCRVHIGE